MENLKLNQYKEMKKLIIALMFITPQLWGQQDSIYYFYSERAAVSSCMNGKLINTIRGKPYTLIHTDTSISNFYLWKDVILVGKYPKWDTSIVYHKYFVSKSFISTYSIGLDSLTNFNKVIIWNDANWNNGDNVNLQKSYIPPIHKTPYSKKKIRISKTWRTDLDKEIENTKCGIVILRDTFFIERPFVISKDVHLVGLDGHCIISEEGFGSLLILNVNITLDSIKMYVLENRHGVIYLNNEVIKY